MHICKQVFSGVTPRKCLEKLFVWLTSRDLGGDGGGGGGDGSSGGSSGDGGGGGGFMCVSFRINFIFCWV